MLIKVKFSLFIMEIIVHQINTIKELNKIPFMMILGDKEIASNSFSIRGHGGKDFGKMSINELKSFILTKSSEAIKDF